MAETSSSLRRAGRSARQVTTLTYPGNHEVDRGYDHAGRLTSVQSWADTNPATFDYDDDGNWSATSYPNGVDAARSHDATGRLTSLTYATATTTLATLTYTHTDAGLLDTATPSTGAPGTATTYTYSNRGQLTSHDGTGTIFTYDTAGRLTRTSTGTTLDYDNGDQLTTATPSSGPTTTFSYDNQGQRAASQVTGDPNPTSYTYDQAGNLTSYTPPTGPAVDYTSDGDGLRAAVTRNTVTNPWTWDHVTSDLPLLLTDTTNAYLYGPSDTPLEQITLSNSTRLWLHGDQLASTTLATDTTGTVAATWTYDPYGTTTSHTGTATTPLQFNGQYHDTTSGLYYLRARPYDPTTGQFLIEDPLHAATQERYEYASDDPVNLDDPGGLSTAGRCLGLAVAGVTFFGTSICVVQDDEGDVGVSIEGGAGAGTPAVGVSTSNQFSDAATIWDLNGEGYFGGGSVAPFAEGPDLEARYSWGQDGCGRQVHAVELGAGIGLEVVPFGEIHGGISETKVWGFHLPEALNSSLGRAVVGLVL